MLLSAVLTISVLSPCTYAAEVSAVSEAAGTSEEAEASETAGTSEMTETSEAAGVSETAETSEETEEEDVLENAESGAVSAEDAEEEGADTEATEETSFDAEVTEEEAASAEEKPEADSVLTEEEAGEEEADADQAVTEENILETELPADVEKVQEENAAEEPMMVEAAEYNLTIDCEEDNDITIDPGESVDLSVSASVEEGSISYEWYKSADEWYESSGWWKAVEGETSAVLHLADITESCGYKCIIKDDYGNYGEVYFSITIDSGLTASAEADDYIIVKFMGSADLKVSASVDAGTISYQWYENDEEMEGKTEAALHLENITQNGYYECKVKDDYGNEENAYFYVTVDSGFTVSEELSNYITVKPMESVDLKVSASVDVGNLFYQWYVNDEEIEGKTEAALHLEQVTQRDTYMCEVRDDYDHSEEIRFYVDIDSGLTVSRKTDRDIKVKSMGSADLEVSASVDEGNISYQWYDENSYEELDGETNPVLHLTEIKKDGEYSCRVEDDYGNRESIFFSVTVDSGFTVSGDLDNYITVKPMGSADLEVSASVDAGSLSYQWYEDYEEMEGKTEAALHLENITQKSFYTCEVKDDYGHSETFYFYITVDSGFTIHNQWGNYITAKPHESVDLTVSASAASGNLSYDWNVEGETGATLHLADVVKSGTYYCYVSDDYGNRERIYFYLTVDGGLKIDGALHRKVTVKRGDSADLTVSASVESGNLSYTWYGPSELKGETKAALHLDNVTGNRVYSCYVKDDYGNQKKVRFSVVADGGLRIDYNSMQTDFRVEPGDSAELTVAASTENGELSYRWYNEEDEVMEETGPALRISNITEDCTYSCRVSNSSGDSKWIEFTVTVTGSLYVDRKAMKTAVVVPYGENVDLTMIAKSPEASLTYNWGFYEEDEEEQSLEETGAALHLQAVTDSREYYCTVSDSQNTERTNFFVLCIPNEEIDTLYAGDQKEMVIEDYHICKMYKAVPEETGEYVFGLRGGGLELAWLFDEDMNTMTRTDQDSAEWFYQLSGGNTYYFLIWSDMGRTGDYVISMEKVDGGVSCAHSWDGGKVTKEPDCAGTGVKTYTCTLCGGIKEETIPATGHTAGSLTVTKVATCTAAGTREQKCTVCGAVLKTETIAAAGHSWNSGIITKGATCTVSGVKTYLCTKCKETKTEAIPAAGHSWGAWTVTKAATVFEPASETRTCSICKTAESRTSGSKLSPTMKVNASSITLKTGQSTKALKVTGLADGDYVKSWKSKKTSLVKVSGKSDGTCTIKAQKKTGSTSIVITLASGKTKTIKVKVQKSTVTTTKISGISKKLTLKKGKSVTLAPVLTPITSTQKVTYKTSDKKVVTVNSKGKLTAKKKGKAVITITSGKKSVKCTVTVK